jgi:tetratricopeptide (TPR) repeat protein
LALGNLAALLLDNSNAEFHFKRAAELAPLRSNRRLQYADFKLRSGDLSGARTSLEEITRQAPDYVPAYARLSDIALTERQFDQASTLSKKILALDPGNYDGMLLSARVRVGKGDAKGALANFERLATAYPRIPQVHYHVATAHLLNENPARASTALQQALALDPQHTDSILVLAEINIRQNNAASAISALKQLAQQQPQVFQAHLTLARAYRSLNQGESAAQVYDNMAQLFPRNGQSHFAWGQLLLAQRKADAARQKFERSLELARDFLPAIEELANLDIAAKQFAAAEKRIADAIARNPKTPGLLLLAAKIHSAQTNHTAAEQALSRAIVLDPNYDPAYLALARVYVESNRPQEAVEKLNALVARSTNNIAAWLQLGIVHHQSKNYPAARDAYEKLLTIDPRFFPALNNLASLYSENLNQLDRARTLARSARDQRPDDPVVADTLGWVLFKRGEYSGALPLLQQSAEKLTKSSEVQFHLGMTHYMLGDQPSARSAFERSLAGGQEFPGKAEAEAKLALLSKSAAEPASVATLEKQLAASPRDPLLRTRLANAYEQAGAFEKAANTYQSAIQQNPRNVSAMLKLAQVYAGPLRDPAKALQIARNARVIAPDDRAVAQTLGRLAFESGDYKWSLSLLEEGARNISDQPETLYDLAWARFSAGRVAEAFAAMKQALATGKPFAKESDAKRFVEMTAIAQQAGQNDTSAARVSAVLKQDNDYIPALFASAVLEQRAGNASGARDRFNAILKRFPDFTPAHKGLALLLSQSSPASDAAFQHAIRAREILPNDSDVARALGVIAFHRKDYARATELLKERSAAIPQDAEAFYYLGMAHFHLKQTNASRVALERAVSLDARADFVAQARQTLSELN